MAACNCSSKVKVVIAICTGIFCVLIGVVLGPIIDAVVHSQIKEKVVLKEGSEVFKIWSDPPFPIYQKFYLFNLDNPDEFSSGEKANLTEKGPYTYREYRVKDNITFFEDGKYLNYSEKKFFVFEESLSSGNESDLITSVNPLIPAIAQLMHHSNSTIQKVLNLILIGFSEKLSHTKTVHEMLWGYPDPLLTAGKLFDPSWFTTDIVGFMAGKNDSYDGFYKINTGKENIEQIGQIELYNGSSTLDFWTTPYANMINGTDGSLQGPFIKKSDTLYTFITDTCRSLPGKYNRETTSKYGLNVYEFIPPDTVFANSSVNPDNIGFCTPQTNCLGTGILNVSTCIVLDDIHQPIALSKPHFMGAADKYLLGVNGLHPDPAKHRTKINVNPLTGVMLEANKRLQVNIDVQQAADFTMLKDVKSTMLPIMWIDEGTEVDKKTSDQLYNMVYEPIKIANALRYTIIAIGAAILICTIIYITVVQVKKRRSPETQPLIPVNT